MQIRGPFSTSEVYSKYSGVNNKGNTVSRSKDKKDSFALSTTGKDFQKALQYIKELPDIKEEKVEAVAEKLNAGTYHVSSSQVAESILNKFDIKA